MIWVPLILAAVIAAIACVPWLKERQRIRIGRQERQVAPGKFVQLPQGITHYKWHGGARGKVIVAIHGLTTPSIVWDTVTPGLVAMGYRVLTYDLFGRGLSDAPNGLHNRHFYLRQLTDLLHAQGIDEDITLLGYSMGGAIATAFAQNQPHRVSQVLLVAPSGIKTVETSFSAWCRRIPHVGDWVHSIFGARRMLRAVQSDLNPHGPKAVLAEQRAQLNRQGYLAAVLSSRRGILSENQEDAHRALSSQKIPVAAVWGGCDPVVPVTALGLLAVWNREARQEVVKDANHDLPFSHGELVSAAFRDLLKVP